MAEAVAWAKPHPPGQIDRALGTAAQEWGGQEAPAGALLTLITPLTGSAPASSIRDIAVHWSAFLSLPGSVGALRSFA